MASSLLDISSYDPVLHIPIYFMIFNISWTYIVGEITGNSSQVDRMWTFFPPIYTIYFALLPLLSFAPKDIQDGGLKYRVVLMAGLQLIWMTRLSYNTWRRGLFTMKEEDYRWQIIRDNIPSAAYKVFSLIFIAAMQNGILYGLGYPAYLALRNGNTPLGARDALLTGLALLDLLAEFVADNQQYSFQTYKHSKPRVLRARHEEWFWARQRWTEEDAKRGFVVRGLWAWSRHPNFAAEQTFWWLMVFFPIMTGHGSLDLPSLEEILSSSTYSSLSTFSAVYAPLEPLLPGIALSLLFLGSTAFTEWITRRKYPAAYKAYQQRVGMFSPVTTLMRGWYWQATGQREEIDKIIWGSGKAPNGVKAD
ncbi:hypothetical protein CPB86DRAFT_695896 [Serendipita vermifera]|nr:hypothetical protein CPB86DRAFT_695896 [Serendipita vermifera]